MKSLWAEPGGTHPPGSVVSVPDDVARQLVAGGYAEWADLLPEADTRPAELEQATVQPPQQAVHPANRRRRGR